MLICLLSFEGQRNNSTGMKIRDMSPSHAWSWQKSRSQALHLCPGAYVPVRQFLVLKLLFYLPPESRVDCYWVRQFRAEVLYLCSITKQREGATPVLHVFTKQTNLAKASHVAHRTWWLSLVKNGKQWEIQYRISENALLPTHLHDKWDGN